MLAGLLGLLAAVIVGATARAQSFGDPSHPIPRIETAMHGGAINRLLVVDGELLTVSDDKTMRRWTLPDGRPDGLWRVPIGGGDAGALYALAVSGPLAVVGGRTGDTSFALFFIDLPSGRLLGNVAGFSEPISALAFAEGGTLLAVGLQRHGGLEVIDVKSRRIVAEDRNYGGTVNWLAFSPAGKLASSSADGQIRLYGTNYGHPMMEQAMPEGDKPWGLAFSPDGVLLAVGSEVRAQVGLYLAEHLQRVSTMIGTTESSGALSVVAWNQDGSVLAAAGQYKGGADRNQVRFWPMKGGRIDTTDVVASPDTITGLTYLPDGTTAYVTAQGSFGILGVDGKSRLFRDSEQCDFRDIWQDSFAVSKDGAVADFACRHSSREKLRVDLSALTLAAATAPRDDLKPAVTAGAGHQIDNWRNGTQPRLDGRPVALDANEHVRSVAVVPDGGSVAFGTDFFLRLETQSGETWHRALPAPAWSVCASGNGAYVVAALGDGTIRWYGVRDGSEAISLFVDAHDHRWAVWVPEGFFEHSADGAAGSGAAMVGFQLNRGPGKQPDFVPSSRLYTAFHRRDLVLAKFFGGAQGAAGIADESARIGDGQALLDVASGAVPR